MEKKKRVLSGIRASGKLHLGNYFGMVKGMLDLQENPNYEVFFMVADLHAMTTPFDPKSLAKDTKDVVLDYLAAGLDPARASVFIQSHILEHTELAFLLSTVVTVARMRHLPTYKEKVKLHPDHVTMALLNYPVLMTADILAYKAQAVPVGDDQLPHLEVAREIARKLNEKYAMDFPEPKQYKTKGHYIPSLKGEGKMSKSVEGSYINLIDDLDSIRRKLASTPTDSGKGQSIPKSGGVATLLQLVELFQGEAKRKEYEKAYVSTGISYQKLKDALAEAIYQEIRPIQAFRRELEDKPDYVDSVLLEGAGKARKIARETLKEVKEKMGLL